MKTFLKVVFTIPVAILLVLTIILGIIVRFYRRLYDWTWN